MNSLKTQCEVLVLAVAMGVALLGSILVYPASALGVVAAGCACMVVMVLLRRPLLQSVGLNLLPDAGKLMRMRGFMARVAVVFYVAVAVAVAAATVV
jgi:hypothetical protein